MPLTLVAPADLEHPFHRALPARTRSGRELRTLLVADGCTVTTGVGPHPLKVSRPDRPGVVVSLPNQRQFNKVQLGLYRCQYRRAFSRSAPF